MIKPLLFIWLATQLHSSFKVDNSSFNFGNIKENSVVSHSYKISNTSKIPILFYSVSTTCGCTTSSYPKIIKPNTSGYVKINFDSRGNKGVVKKFVVLMTNTKEEYYKLTIEGTVY